MNSTLALQLVALIVSVIMSYNVGALANELANERLKLIPIII